MYLGNRQKYGAGAPRCGSGPPPKTFNRNQALKRANDDVYYLTQRVIFLETCERDFEIERNSFCLVIKNKKLEITQLESSLEIANDRIKILESQQMSTAETNNSREMPPENFHLLERLRVQEEKMAEAQLISHQEKERMVQEYEAKLSDQILQNLNLFKKNEGLSLGLTESTEPLVSNESWKQEYEDLEKKTTQDLALQQEAMEALQVKYQEMANEVENLMVQKLSETLKVNKEKESILHKLRETQQQLISEEEKFKDLETRVCKELNLKQEMSETRVTQLYSDNLALEEKLNKQQANNHQLEAEYKLLTDWRDGMADKQKHQEENRSLKLQQMEEMTKENQILITKVKQLQDENTLLENICLDLKKKKRGIFGRRMQERQVEMDKMKQKMQDQETKRSEKEEKKSREEKKTFQG